MYSIVIALLVLKKLAVYCVYGFSMKINIEMLNMHLLLTNLGRT